MKLSYLEATCPRRGVRRLVASRNVLDSMNSAPVKIGYHLFPILALALLVDVLLGADNNEEEEDSSKVAVILGKPNPDATSPGEAFPSMDNRPVDLRPGTLPERVRYVFASDDEVVAAADILRLRLLASDLTEGSLFGDAVLLQAGAWEEFRSNDGIAIGSTKPFSFMIPMSDGPVFLEGGYLKDQAPIDELEIALRDLIHREGGGTIRALTPAEMEKWWTFIGFDIEEPTLAIETANGAHVFVFAFTSKGVFILDELNNLPD